MALIFSASNDPFSFQHSSSIIAPILRWFIPHISEAGLHCLIMVSRKAGHVTEYAILALLVWRLLRSSGVNTVRPWRWPDVAWTLLTVVLYAASDEFHQRFVPSREASVGDVLIDTSGAILALLLVWVRGRWRKRW